MDGKWLSLDELSPRVDLCSCWRIEQTRPSRYRLPGHHWVLPVAGEIASLEPTRGLVAGPGDLLCFRPAEWNSYRVVAGTVFFQAHVYFAPPPRHALTPWLDDIGPLPQLVRLGALASRARECFETLCMEMPQPGAAHRLRMHVAALELVAISAQAAGGTAIATAERLDALQRARQRLANDPAAALPIARVAREAGMSADHFIRRFRSRFGETPAQYRLLARLRWAAQRLRGGDEPIKAIARALGFSDAGAFARTFRRHLGVRPSDLRAGAGAIIEAPAQGEGLFPLNRHLMPAHAGPEWMDRFRTPPPAGADVPR